jgi:hypothetical protein
MPHHVGGLITSSQEAADRLAAPFPITLTLSRQAIDGWSQRRLTADLSDDQMAALVAQFKLYLEEVILPELVQSVYDHIGNYVSRTDRTRKRSLA